MVSLSARRVKILKMEYEWKSEDRHVFAHVEPKSQFPMPWCLMMRPSELEKQRNHITSTCTTRWSTSVKCWTCAEFVNLWRKHKSPSNPESQRLGKVFLLTADRWLLVSSREGDYYDLRDASVCVFITSRALGTYLFDLFELFELSDLPLY